MFLVQQRWISSCVNMSSLATRIKNIFSFNNSDSYHVHKATEEELLSQPQPRPSLRRAPPPPTSAPSTLPGSSISMVNGGGEGGNTNSVNSANDRNSSNQSAIALNGAHDKKMTRRKVSLPAPSIIFIAHRGKGRGIKEEDTHNY